jgi:hypothetical protein
MRSLVVLVGALVSLTAATSHAQQVVLGQLYGSGVHAYFAGDVAKAYDQLSAAITAGCTDPRAFYFRGLAYLKLGREAEAVQDFRKGAELETKDLGRSYNVGRSLERVQGFARQKLETYRLDARLAALEESERVRKVKFETIKREEERVLRRQADGAPATTLPEEPAVPEDADAFGNPAEPKKAEKAPAADEKPADEMSEEPKAKADPFKEEPAEEAKSAEEKPAAEEEPAAEKPAEKPAEENPDDVFGS